jgi:hypothetical protein
MTTRRIHEESRSNDVRSVLVRHLDSPSHFVTARLAHVSRLEHADLAASSRAKQERVECRAVDEQGDRLLVPTNMFGPRFRPADERFGGV